MEKGKYMNKKNNIIIDINNYMVNGNMQNNNSYENNSNINKSRLEVKIQFITNDVLEILPDKTVLIVIIQNNKVKTKLMRVEDEFKYSIWKEYNDTITVNSFYDNELIRKIMNRLDNDKHFDTYLNDYIDKTIELIDLKLQELEAKDMEVEKYDE